MSKTITLQDATVADLLQALGAPVAQSPVQPQPPLPMPANATVVTTSTWNEGFVRAVPQGGVLVMPFVPTVAAPRINYANYSGSPIARTVTISRTPADFRTTIDRAGVNGPVAGRFGGIGFLAPTLTTGAQYFLNIADMVWSTGTPVCKPGTDAGDVIVTFS